MSFDDNAIKQTLRRKFGKAWDGYLDKIVNIPIYLPAPDRERLGDVISSKIEEVKEYYNLDNWDQERWQNALINGLSAVLLKRDNLRDIYRYINRLLFFTRQYPKEINMVDLLALESLRIFSPASYLFIYRNKGILTGGVEEIRDRLLDMDGEKTLKDDIERQLKGFKKENISLLEFLFPRLSSLRREGKASFGATDKEIRDLRICAPDHFAKYFIYHLSAGNLSQMILDDFITNKHTAEEYTSILQTVINDHLFDDFANRFESNLDNIDEFRIEDIIVSLFNISEIIPYEAMLKSRMDSHDGFLNTSITKLLLRLKDQGITNKIQHILMRNNALYLPILFVHLINKWNDGDGALLPPILKPIAPTMVQIMVDRIKKDYKSNNLINRKGLSLILGCWKEWDEKDQVEEFIKDNFDRKELVKLIADYVNKDYGRGPKFMMEDLEKLVDPNIINNYLNNASMMQITDDDREVIKIFRRAYATWRNKIKTNNQNT